MGHHLHQEPLQGTTVHFLSPQASIPLVSRPFETSFSGPLSITYRSLQGIRWDVEYPLWPEMPVGAATA